MAEPAMKEARRAYQDRSVEDSKAVHAAKAGTISRAKEDHGGAGSDYIKSIVFGGLDGIVTTFAIVASVAGAGLPAAVVIVSGFAKLVGDGISMGLGDAISEVAEHKLILSELAREKWETENMLDEEVAEMVEIYKEKGFTEEEAREVMDILTRNPAYREYFVHHMMVQELGHRVPDPDENPWKAGGVTFGSFLFFGTLPLIPYIGYYASNTDLSYWGQFGITIAITVLTLFFLGVTQAKIIRVPTLWGIAKQGILMMINGSLAALAAYLVGWGLEEAVGVKSC